MPAASEISFGTSLGMMLAFASAAFWGGTTSFVRAENEEKIAPSVRGKTSIATANWFGDSPGEDHPTTAVCVKEDGSYVCLIPPNSEGKSHLTLTIEGIERDCEILSIDPVSGICLAKASISEPTESMTLAVGDEVAPGGEIIPLNPNVSARLAGIDREYLGQALPIALLRIHLSRDRADCIGEPVFCPSGELVGLLTNRELAENRQAHAVPAQRIAKVISDFENEKPTGRIWLGASFHRQSTTPEVVTVTPDSPAEKAGLQPGDIVVKAGETSVSSLPELAAACEAMVDGEPIIFSILRRLKIVECELVPKVLLAKKAELEKK